ncbi:MAG: hypothetical protein VX550_07000, partial [Bacteroidota bacterium]|nr:hypothetical protein [Bacteroidota bacterium]
LNNYSRIINDVVLSYQSYLLNNEIGLESRFKGAFNFELEGSYSFNDLSSDNLENRFENWTANGSTELRFFKHFTWRTNVEYTYFKNQSSGEANDFLIANSSLEYWKESTAWTFKIQLTNAFDTDIKFSNSFNQFQSIENRRFVQPRILLFAVIYNL